LYLKQGVGLPLSSLQRPVEVLGICFRFVTVSQARFFGVDRRTLEGKAVYVTDREKTLLTRPPVLS
jgi:predicted transcriptional regulator of viral defense system